MPLPLEKVLIKLKKFKQIIFQQLIDYDGLIHDEKHHQNKNDSRWRESIGADTGEIPMFIYDPIPEANKRYLCRLKIERDNCIDRLIRVQDRIESTQKYLAAWYAFAVIVERRLPEEIVSRIWDYVSLSISFPVGAFDYDITATEPDWEPTREWPDSPPTYDEPRSNYPHACTMNCIPFPWPPGFDQELR